MRGVILAVLVCLMATNAYAVITVKKYMEWRDEPTRKEYAAFFVDGMGEAFLWGMFGIRVKTGHKAHLLSEKGFAASTCDAIVFYSVYETVCHDREI